MFFWAALDAVWFSCSGTVLGAGLEGGRLPRGYLVAVATYLRLRLRFAKPRFRFRLRFAPLRCDLIEKLRSSSRQLGEVAFDFGGDPVGLFQDAAEIAGCLDIEPELRALFEKFAQLE